jgi:hypothetical protein
MTRTHSFASLIPAGVLVAPAQAQHAKTVVANASTAMDERTLTSIMYYGVGGSFAFGQSDNANGPWPRTNLNDCRRAIDSARVASRADIAATVPGRK